MKYRLQDLIDIEHFQELQDRLNEIYSFPSSIIDNDGNILTATSWQEICMEFHRKNGDAERLCIKSDQYIVDHIHEANPALTYHCPHGLVDNATPIIIDGVHYANFFTGQFFLEEPDLEFFRAQAQKYGFDEEAYLRTVKKVPIWTQKQLESYLFFIKGLITVISESGLKKLKEIENRKRIQKSEKRYRSILKAAMDGYWLTNTSGRLLEVNDAYCRMSGYSEDELLNIYISDLEAVETPDLVATHMQKVILKGSDRFETKHRRKDGTVFDVEVSIQFRADEGGQCVCFLRDISDRKLAEKASVEYSETLKEAQSVAKIGSWWYDPVTQMPTWTAEMFRIFGLEPKPQALPYEEHRKIIHPDDWELFDTAVTKAVEDGIGYNLELRIIHPSGEIRYVNTRCVAEKNDDGVATRLIGTTQDITERKQAMEALSLSESILRETQSIAHIGSFKYNFATDRVYWSDELYRIFGQEKAASSMTFKDVRAMIHPDDLPHWESSTNRAIAAGDSVVTRNRIIRPDGSVRHHYVLSKVKTGANGEPLEISGSVQDITELAQAEEALQQLSSRLELATKSAKIGVWDWDVINNHMSWDDRMLELYGYTRESFPGGVEAWDKGLHPEDKEKAWDETRAALRGEGEFNTEFRVLHPDGKILHLKADGLVIRGADGKPLRMLGINYDITDRRQAEDNIRRSEEKYRLIAENMSDVVSILDMNLRFTYTSPSIRRMTGFSPEAHINHPVEEIMPPEHFEKVMKAFEEEMMIEASGKADPYRTRTIEFEQYTQDRSTVWVEASCSLLRDKDKHPVGILAVSRNINERKQAELERERLMAAIEQTGDAIVVTDTNGDIQYVNPAFQEVSGYAWEEAINRNPSLLKSGEQDKLFYQKLWETISSGRTWSGRMINKKKDGTLYTEDATISPVIDSSGKIINFVAVKKDITEHLRLSAQLQQAQKLESIGTLAGGVAHDFNNMLSVIIGHAEMAMDQVHKSQPLYEDLSEILKSAQRSAALTRQLLAFARRQTVIPVVLDLNDTIEGMLKMLKRLIGENIYLVWNPGSKLDKVKIDPAQVDQILANLLVNARDAIKGGGTVSIGTENVVLSKADCIGKPDLLPGQYIMITVNDSGSGMDTETLAHIFEPFYTTKEVGKGTGLGLSTVYGIVKQNHGLIHVTSEPGRGTTFNIYLQPFKEPVETPANDITAKNLKGLETLLLVEDEENILKLIKSNLQRYGYKVLSSNQPIEALALAQSHRGKIHLLITDVIMPEMNGKELMSRLVEIHPGIKYLYISGYTADVIAQSGVLDEGTNFLQKPFSVQVLVEKVREILDSAE